MVPMNYVCYLDPLFYNQPDGYCKGSEGQSMLTTDFCVANF
jgi:hypothetical protein